MKPTAGRLWRSFQGPGLIGGVTQDFVLGYAELSHRVGRDGIVRLTLSPQDGDKGGAPLRNGCGVDGLAQVSDQRKVANLGHRL